MYEGPIFDIHQHLGGVDLGLTNTDHGGDGEYQNRVAIMNRFAVTGAAVLPPPQYDRTHGIVNTRTLNDSMAAYRDEHFDRCPIALGTIEPLYQPDVACEEIGRIADELRLDGVAWHHRFQGVYLADGRMHRLLDACAEDDLPAFVHIYAESTMQAVWALEEMATAHPDVQFVALDGFSGATQIRFLFGLADRVPNVMFDTAIAIPLGRAIEEFVAKFGSDRLLFGTDLYVDPPSYHWPHVLTEIAEAPTLSADDQEKIFWSNAVKLFPGIAGLT